MVKNIHQKQTQYNLESLRGFAAIFVVIHHIIFHKQYLDPTFFPKYLKYFEPSGHFCVLIFFVLSGYVIGASNKQKLRSDNILQYIKKRFLRIYPIYFVSLTVAFIVAIPYSVGTIITNYTITQGVTGIAIAENNPIWSLNFEVLYYILFIPISYFEISPIIVLLGSIVIGVTNYVLFPAVNMPIISSYFYGFAFWITGLCIAKYIPKTTQTSNFSRLCSGLFLILSYKLFSINDFILHKIVSVVTKKSFVFPQNVYWVKIMVPFFDLSVLAYCFFLVLLFSEKEWKYKKHLALLLQILPFVTLIVQTIKHHHELQFFWDIIPPLCCFIISLFLYYTPIKGINIVSEKIINWGIKLGGISYGIYIIHFPILVIFSKIPFWQGSLLFFVIRAFLFIILTIVSAYVLEKKIQKWVVGFFKKKSRSAGTLEECPAKTLKKI